MRLTQKIRHHLRMQAALFLSLFTLVVAGLMWLSAHYSQQFDWTQSSRNTITEASRKALAQITQPTTLKAFVGSANKELRDHISRLTNAFSRVNSNVKLEFIDPVRNPSAVREYEIGSEGEVVVTQDNRTTQLAQLNEQELLNALLRVSRTQQRRISFVTGHKERNYSGQTELDYTTLGSELRKRGYVVDTVNLTARRMIAEDTNLLIIADPRSEFLPGEVQAIEDYLQRGGNLLWLLEPLTPLRLDSLAEDLGVDPLPGIVIDPSTEAMGISDRRFTLIGEYPFHPITQGFNAITVFPTSRAFELAENDVWQQEVFLETQQQAWSESDDSNPDYTLDSAQDVVGPLIVGVSLTRTLNEFDKEINSRDHDVSNPEDPADSTDPIELDENGAEKNSRPAGALQRVVVIGDADFLADAYVGQVGNMLLANNIFGYLIGEQTFINLPNQVNLDSNLVLSAEQKGLIGSMFVVVLPGLLAGMGFAVWTRRRKR